MQFSVFGLDLAYFFVSLAGDFIVVACVVFVSLALMDAVSAIVKSMRYTEK